MILLYSSELTMTFNELLSHEDIELFFESQWLACVLTELKSNTIFLKEISVNQSFSSLISDNLSWSCYFQI